MSAQTVMCDLPAGSFSRGSNAGDADERPRHKVYLSAFRIAAKETTCAEFEAFVAATGYRSDAERQGASYVWDTLGWHLAEGVHWRHDEQGRLRPGGSAYPVVHVSWFDAAHYCNWKSRQAGLQAVYHFDSVGVMSEMRANGYRLPTEAEWEYAAGALEGPFAGSGALGKLGWYAGNAARRVHLVGQKQPNRYGIFDMTGNVWEWCHDYYAADYYRGSIAAHDPGGPPHGAERAVRGGSWNNHPRHCRIGNRSSRDPGFSDGSVGFRIVLPSR